MADRGRLFYASDGLLWEVDPTADISGEPAQADLQPVRMGELAAEVLELDQQADDGTDRVFIRGSDGAIKAEVFFDGTNTVINPLTGSVDVQGALATEQADITGETYIEATRGSDTTGNTAGTFINAFDGESADNRNEFNASAQFVPDATAKYRVYAVVKFASGSPGDQYDIRLRDTGATDPPGNLVVYQNNGAAPRLPFIWEGELTGGNTYEVQAHNANSQFDINSTGTRGVISKLFSNP